jgi:hypothetical protein
MTGYEQLMCLPSAPQPMRAPLLTPQPRPQSPGPKKGAYKVIRGGDAAWDHRFSTSTFRFLHPPHVRDWVKTGFRVATHDKRSQCRQSKRHDRSSHNPHTSSGLRPARKPGTLVHSVGFALVIALAPLCSTDRSCKATRRQTDLTCQPCCVSLPTSSWSRSLRFIARQIKCVGRVMAT